MAKVSLRHGAFSLLILAAGLLFAPTMANSAQCTCSNSLNCLFPLNGTSPTCKIGGCAVNGSNIGRCTHKNSGSGGGGDAPHKGGGLTAGSGGGVNQNQPGTRKRKKR